MLNPRRQNSPERKEMLQKRALKQLNRRPTNVAPITSYKDNKRRGLTSNEEYITIKTK